MAVGSYNETPDPSSAYHAESLRLIAGRWAAVTFPNSAEAADIDCASGSMCLAVGTDIRTHHEAAWAWNGTSWRSLVVPRVSGETDSLLDRVSCPTTSECVTTGLYYKAESSERAQSLRWNGTSWQRLTVADPAARINGVSCATAASCLAVVNPGPGGTDGTPVVWRLDQNRWRVATAPPTPGGGRQLELSSISCPTATSCEAAGTIALSDGTVIGPYVARGDGRTWTRSALPAVAGLHGVIAESISCADSTGCALVAFGANGQEVEKSAIFATVDGLTWSVQSQPTYPASVQIELSGVSCAAVCAAVGSHYDPSLPSIQEYALLRS